MKILLCSTCSTANYAQDREVLEVSLQAADLPYDITIEDVECMGGCDQPASIGLQAPNRASYVFSGVDVQKDADDILTTCTAYLEAKDGWIENALSCGRLRHLLRARIPALKP